MFKRWLPVKFYDAEGGAGGSASQDGAGGNNEGGSSGSKTFTQEEVNAMLAREKQQGKNSVLKALGIKSIDEGKSALESAKNKADADKSAEERASEALNAEKTARAEAETNLIAANRKIAVMQAGFDPKYVDDVVAVAAGKVTDEKDFEAVIAAMKESHPFYLAGSAEKKDDKKGTGKDVSGYKKDNGSANEAYGARLAKKQIDSRKRIESVKFFN